MLIIDDLFTKEETESIKNTLLSENFPWFYNENTVGKYAHGPQKDNKTYEYLMFTHVFIYDDDKGHTVINSEKYLPLVELIIDKVQFRLKKQFAIYRAKANFQSKVSTDLVHNTPHVDFLVKEDYLTMIYYANDSDGKTFLLKNRKNPKDENEEYEIEHTISSKEGRVLIFDGKRVHSGSHPKEGHRLVINFAINFQEGIFK
jgi:hypothetical protein